MRKKKLIDLKKLKKEINKITYQKIISSNQALLILMEKSKDSKVLDDVVRKKSKKWKMVFDVNIRSTSLKMEGIVDVTNSIYKPFFDMRIIVSVVKGFLKKKRETIEFKVFGTIDNLMFEPKNVDMRFKKLVALFLVPAYIKTVLNPIGQATFNKLYGGVHGNR